MAKKKIEMYSFKKDGVTQGLLCNFMSCRQKTEYILNRWRVYGFSVPLTYGNIAHGILETAYNFRRDNAYEDIVDTIITEIPYWIKAHEVEAQKEHSQRIMKKESEKLEMICTMLEVVMPQYFKYWKSKDDKLLSTWLQSECDFRIPLHGTWIRGKMDGAFSIKGVPWLLETKTKAQIVEEDLMQTLQFDFQTNLYLLALWKITGKVPGGVLYNVIRRSGMKLKKNEGIPSFRKRLEADVSKQPSHYFTRFQIAITKQDLVQFESDLGSVIEEFKNWNAGDMKTYRNVTACITRGRCTFLPICSSGTFAGFYQHHKMFAELED